MKCPAKGTPSFPAVTAVPEPVLDCPRPNPSVSLQLPNTCWQLDMQPLTLMSGNWPRYVSMVSNAWSTSFWW